MVGPLVRFPAGAKYFLIAHMSPLASDILSFVVNSPNILFQVFFKSTQCRYTFFEDFCFKMWSERGVLNIFFKCTSLIILLNAILMQLV